MIMCFGEDKSVRGGVLGGGEGGGVDDVENMHVNYNATEAAHKRNGIALTTPVLFRYLPGL